MVVVVEDHRVERGREEEGEDDEKTEEVVSQHLREGDVCSGEVVVVGFVVFRNCAGVHFTEYHVDVAGLCFVLVGTALCFGNCAVARLLRMPS